MNILIQDDSESRVYPHNAASTCSFVDTIESDRSAISVPDVAANTQRLVSPPIRRFQPLRFSLGLLSTTSGVALILGVGFRVLEMRGVGGDFSLPMTGISVLIGVMLLGGGFGVMATSSSGFDEGEFDRLATAGNISTCQSACNDTVAPEDHHAHQTAA